MKHRGHVKEVSKVKFSADGRHIISLGKYDRTVIIWKVLPEVEKPVAKKGKNDEDD